MSTHTAIPSDSASIHTPQDGNAAARQFSQQVTEEEIWQSSKNFWMRSHFPYPTTSPLVWVKFGSADKQAEADMQRLAWQWVRGERQARRCSPGIHIPEVFRTFTRGDQTFIIMELIHGTVLAKSVYARPVGSLYPVPHCYDLIAEAIQLLRRMPVPPDATPGPYTPDHRLRIIKHPLFKDQEATVVYRNIKQLEDHINRVLYMFLSKPTKCVILLHLADTVS